MALFRKSASRTGAGKAASGKAAPGRTKSHWRGALRWWAWLVGGVVLTAGGGYLVAHFVLFPSPMRTGEREVPTVLGLGEDEAKRDIERARLAVNVVAREPHPTLPPGTVVWQDPPPGVAVPRAFPVELTLSNGMPMVAVPSTRGFDPFFAQRLLLAAGLGLDAIDSVDDVALPSGVVTGSSPAAGDSVPIGMRVLLHVTR